MKNGATVSLYQVEMCWKFYIKVSGNFFYQKSCKDCVTSFFISLHVSIDAYVLHFSFQGLAAADIIIGTKFTFFNLH